MRNPFLIGFPHCLVALLITACTPAVAPTMTPTYQLSGPTIAPTAPLFIGPPTEGPPPQTGSVGISDPTAAAQPRDGVLPPLAVGSVDATHQEIEITAADGALLVGNLYQQGSERRPGVLLLGPDRLSWGEFPAALNAAGFTVLVMPVRDGTFISDATVMIETLTSGIADPARIGAVGAAEGADLVLQACAELRVCDTVVLLSPLAELALLDALPRYNPRSLFIIVSQNDEQAFVTARSISEAATGEKAFEFPENAGRGTAMLNAQPDLAAQVIKWLQAHLV